MYFYNPETMNKPETTLAKIREVDPNWQIVQMRMRFHNPYASREEAVKEDTSRVVMFYENGVLYEALRITSWEWAPCTDVKSDSGINWITYYATSTKRLHEYLSEHYATLTGFNPILNANGLYEIQVHYDGRCR